jgi:hypothetical protein
MQKIEIAVWAVCILVSLFRIIKDNQQEKAAAKKQNKWR